MLAAVTVGNLTDVTNAPDTTSIAALLADDGGDGISLREALDAANSNPDADTINFSPSLSGRTLVLTQGQLVITSDIEIDGDAVGNDNTADITISGNDVSRVLRVSGNQSQVTLKALHLTRGLSFDSGGGIMHFVDSPDGSSTLTLSNSIVSNSHAEERGGGIYSLGTLNLTGSTLSGNTAVNNGGGIQVRGTATLTNSTLSENTASSSGGGIFVYGGGFAYLTNTTLAGNHAASGGGIRIHSRAFRSGTLTLTNCTVTDNRADGGSGGGISNSGSATLTNTIVIANQASGNMDISGTFVDAGGNITNALPSDVFDDVSPSGVPILSDNGGSVLTIALRAFVGNPALDTGVLPSGLTADAIGNLRDFDIAAINNGGAVDSGAVELQQQSESLGLVVTTAADVSDPFDNETSLREAVTFANSASDHSDITFDASLAGQTLILTQGQIQISSDLTIEGDVTGNDDVADITISGNDASRVFFNSGEANLNALMIRDGNAFDGGGISNFGTMTLANSTLFGNVARFNGGGIENRGTLTINNSTLSENSVSDYDRLMRYGGGGGLYNSMLGVATVTNSTFSGNTSRNYGGGVNNFLGAMSVNSSTFSGNTAYNFGGGICNRNLASYTDTLTLTNTIVLGNSAFGLGDEIFGTYTDGGGNITSGLPSSVFELANNAGAGSLVNNGGPVQTIALRQDASNPALDIGVPLDEGALGVDLNGDGDMDDVIGTDARGQNRNIDLPGVDNGGTVDAGAFELASLTNQAVAPTVVSVTIDDGPIQSRPDLWSTLTVVFDADVSVSAGDLSLFNVPIGGTALDLTGIGFDYNATTFTATWNFDVFEPLPAAFYTYQLNSSSIAAGGLSLDGDGSGSAGGDYVDQHYVAIPGDLNLDGDVDVSQIVFGPGGVQNVGDASVLLANLGTTTGATYYQGDVNGDGDVDVTQIVFGPGGVQNVGDASILLANLGTNVVPPASAVAASSHARRAASTSVEPLAMESVTDLSSIPALSANTVSAKPLGAWESAWHQSVRERLAVADTPLTLSGTTPDVYQAVDDFFAASEEQA